MRRRDFLSALVAGLSASRTSLAAPLQGTKNVMDYGAKPDGKTLNTQSIQRAIDDAFLSGGGTVYVPAGTFLTGRIDLKSRVGLYLGDGSTLLGSTSIGDYHGAQGSADASTKHLIYARDADEVTLAGPGRIDGQGESFWEPSGKPPLPPGHEWANFASRALKEKKSGRPSPMIRFANCRKVQVKDVRLQNSPGWTLHALNCDDVEIAGITITNPIYGPNTDGIDLTGCQNVLVSGCSIATGDDAICIKSENPLGSEPRLIKNVTVTNCRLNTCCNGFKLGTSSEGGFENIEFSNSSIISNSDNFAERVISGVALEVVDGGWIDGVKVSGIQMQQVRTAIFVRLGNRKRVHNYDQHGLRGVKIDNVHATETLLASSITGLPGDEVRDVTLSNITIQNVLPFPAEGAPPSIPEKPSTYPEALMFGMLPTSGLYARHARALALDHVSFSAAQNEMRPTTLFDDVDGAQIVALTSTPVRGPMPIVSLSDSRNISISGTTAPATGTFLAVDGSQSANVVLSGNDLRGAGQPVIVASDVSHHAITLAGNITSGSNESPAR